MADAEPLPPVDIALDIASVFEGFPPGGALGLFRTDDPNAGDNVFAYALVAGEGDGDNGRFSIEGAELRTAAETGPAGSVLRLRVRSTDPAGLWVERALTVTVEPARAPAPPELSTATLVADLPPGAPAGRLSAEDADAGDRHTFSLVAGEGDADNARFVVEGELLRVAGALPAGGAQLTVRVRATDLAGLWAESALTLTVVDPSVRINEIMASNAGSLLDRDGDSSDWIEIFNEQAEEVNLGGWFLTDDPGDLRKWELPARDLAGGGYLLVFASGKDPASLLEGELHTNFQLSAGGEFLALVKPDGETLASAFDPAFPPQRADVSYGAGAEGGGGAAEGFYFPATPGEANGAPSPAAANRVEFSQPRGYYDAPFALELTRPSPGRSSVTRPTGRSQRSSPGRSPRAR